MLRLGVVSFLNSRPLIDGLEADGRVQLSFAVPAALPGQLDRGEVDVALIPTVDVLRSGGRYRVLSDGCIGCDGETMTVRVFSQVPPDRVRTLWTDTDSHTSVALARVLWRELYGRDLELRALDARAADLTDHEAVLLIGDKVVDPGRGSYAYEVDLGGAWRQHTGLPFAFALWAYHEPRPSGRAADLEPWSALLSQARDRGVARAAEIAERDGPAHGWPVTLALRYLKQCLRYTLDARMIAGVELFGRLCAQADLAPADFAIGWPENLRAARGKGVRDGALAVD
jgi:chorismate dehydratase